MATKPATIDDYIAGFPKDVQKALQQVRETIQKAAPKAEETISYAMPAFKQNGNLVYFAAWKEHIGFYATPTGNSAFKTDLAGYKTSKGAIQFPLDKPMPVQLITKLVKFRVKENEEKAALKKKAKK
ncbi:MAG TPA: DUF1801 domain-containing protein [Chitinophagaceae bacterium]